MVKVEVERCAAAAVHAATAHQQRWVDMGGRAVPADTDVDNGAHSDTDSVVRVPVVASDSAFAAADMLAHERLLAAASARSPYIYHKANSDCQHDGDY